MSFRNVEAPDTFDDDVAEALEEFTIGVGPLSDRDRVVVQEGWHKARAHRHGAMEAMALRWRFLCTGFHGLTEVVKHRRAEFPELLYEMLDSAVRALNPGRQAGRREADRPASGAAECHVTHLQVGLVSQHVFCGTCRAVTRTCPNTATPCFRTLAP